MTSPPHYRDGKWDAAPRITLERDPFDRLVKACADSDQYPARHTLLAIKLSRYVTKKYQIYLEDQDEVLFHKRKSQMVFWELWNSDNRYFESEISDLKLLKAHLEQRQMDPVCRHVFIESDHSRAPVNCSAEHLKYLLTYQQVDPTFLEILVSFGDQDEPVDACLSQFQPGSTISAQPPPPSYNFLDRSGRELWYSMLLRALELAAPGASWPWAIRQVAVYHSFDVETGRSFWINVKGNNLLQKRIREDTTDFYTSATGQASEPGASFQTTLDILLIYLTWVEDQWRWAVRDFDERVREYTTKGKVAPIVREPHFTKLQVRPAQVHSNMSKASDRKLPLKTPTSSSYFPDLPEKSRFSLRTSGFLRQMKLPTIEECFRSGQNYEKAEEVQDMNVLTEKLVLEMFNYEDLQNLNILGGRIEEAILTIKLSIGVLADITSFYESLIPCADPVPAAFKTCHSCMPNFVGRVVAIERRLETRQSQLESIYRKLDEGRRLFENMLQYRGLQVSRIFAEHGHESSKSMESIAKKTAQETVSMHIVTILTLLFLPGTFVATFFQSGILEFDGDDPGSLGTWLFRSDVFKLFVAIVFPMTCLLFCGWLIVYRVGRRRLRSTC